MSTSYNSPPDHSGSVHSDCWTWTLQNETLSHLQVTVHFYIEQYYKGIHVSNLISFFSRLSAKLKVNLLYYIVRQHVYDDGVKECLFVFRLRMRQQALIEG